jgi:TonB family protein
MPAIWMVDLVLRVTVVLGITWVAAQALGRHAASLRHLVWTLALASVLLLPVARNLMPRAPVLRPALNTATIVMVHSINSHGPASPRVHEFPWVSALWAWGCALVAWRWMRGALCTSRLVRRSRAVAYAAAQIEREVQIRESADTAVALVWGLRRPVVILPVEAAGWEPERLRAVLAHELAHVKRWDLATHLLAQFACAIYWFHPLVWLAFHRMRQERERACDDTVLREGISGPEYAGYLINMVRSLATQPPADALAMAEARDLEVRVRAILDPAQRRRAAGRKPALLTALAAAVLVLVLASPRATAQGSSVLSGTVVDPNGAVIARAPVSARNLETGVESFAVADMVGHYSFTTLPTGQYALTISAPGFETYEAQVAVSAKGTPRLDMLHVGGTKQSVTVSALGNHPSTASPPGPRARIRVGGNVQAPRLVVQPPTIYPESLKERAVHGVVVLRGTIDTSGQVTNAHVINVPQVDPELAAAALETVKAWAYTPALLDGEPIATDTTITLNFELQ